MLRIMRRRRRRRPHAAGGTQPTTATSGDPKPRPSLIAETSGIRVRYAGNSGRNRHVMTLAQHRAAMCMAAPIRLSASVATRARSNARARRRLLILFAAFVAGTLLGLVLCVAVG